MAGYDLCGFGSESLRAGRGKVLVIAMISIALVVSVIVLVPGFSFNHGAGGRGGVWRAEAATLRELVGYVNNYTLRMYGLLLRDCSGRNLVVSPFNTYVALLVLYEGANRGTRDELSQVLGLQGRDACLAYMELLSMLPVGDNGSARLYIVNGLWLREGFPFRNEYVDAVKTCYNGEVKAFSDVYMLVEEVNEFVNTTTRGLINRLLDPESVNSNTVAVIVSVIYFKANWLKEFQPHGLIRFWTGKSVVDAQAMSVEGNHMRIFESEDYTLIEIPYANTSVSMVILVPRDFNNAAERSAELLSDALARLKDGPLRAEYFKLIMPKFTIDFGAELRELLREMGLKEVFDPNKADFSHMTPGKVWVDSVKHKAVIKAHEKGTEAAAAAAIIMPTAIIPVKTVVVDKPFIYMLVDKTSKIILFLGHVVNPVQANG